MKRFASSFTSTLLSTFFLLFVLSSVSFSQTTTIGGVVRDSVTLAVLDSARVDIVNAANSSEHYTVFTNNFGVWSHTFISNGVDDRDGLPTSFSLEQNYPNPFNPSTNIGFFVHSGGTVTLRVYSVLGQLLDARSTTLTPGGYNIPWTSKGAAGALFYSLEMNGQRLTRKMIQLDGGASGGLGDPTLTHSVAPVSPSDRMLADYRVTVSKFGYEPDSTTVPLANNSNIDFRIQTIHRRAFLIDLHNDVMEIAVGGYQLGVRHTTNHSDLPRFFDGGVDAQMFAIWPSPTQFPSAGYARSIQMIDSFDVQVTRNAPLFAQARTSAEIEQVAASGKMVGILGVEGGHAIEDNLNKLIALYQRGARYLTITWNNSTSWATAAADAQSATRGLSEFGRQVIRTMDSLGMIIDVSHTGIKTIEDILQTSTKPIIASHSGARALRNHYRNLTDAQLTAIAQRGGVVGVVFYPPFLSASSTVNIDTVIRHIDYIKNLVGIDHVALGSDFDGIEVTPVGLENVTKFPSLTLALLRRGYTSTDVKKILGENYMRVFRVVCQ
ncbi:MAG: membrane dipeptidase [Ignavibacteriae bacterium]|nr:membrane dipeptidase [Ignavibacteriota bacterium]